MKKVTFKNKTIIRKPRANGRFTQVPTSIITDNDLKPNAFRILLSMLSDSDDFNISYALLENRHELSNGTVKAAMNNLEECGYLRRTETITKRGFYYTISEYKNLNKELTKNKTAEERLFVENDEKEFLEFLESVSNEISTSSDFESFIDSAIISFTKKVF